MITMQDALTCRDFLHMTQRLKSGLPYRARRNGETQRWKKWPTLFRIPIKIGMYEYGYICNFDSTRDGPVGRGRTWGGVTAQDWCPPERWEAEHKLFGGLSHG